MRIFFALLFTISVCKAQVNSEFELCRLPLLLNFKSNVDQAIWSSNGIIFNNQLSIYDTGMYVITAFNGGCEDKLIINVVPCNDALFYIPNSFTPNNDGVNDSFGPKGINYKYTISIWNRWGECIYEGSTPWSGKNSQNDLYVYKLHAILNENRHKIVYGTVLLLN